MISGSVRLDLAAVKREKQRHRIATLSTTPDGARVVIYVGALAVEPESVRLIREHGSPLVGRHAGRALRRSSVGVPARGADRVTAAEQEPPRTAWTATEIMSMNFPEPRWAIPGIVAEGVTLLAGAPKIGKSWLALNVSTAVAAGGKALGRIDVLAGDVLYLALEDNPRRLQSRLSKVLGKDPVPDRLTFAVYCEVLPTGGAERIAAWLSAHPEARLVVVDVFARVRGTAPNNLNSYDADYLAMGALKRLADKYGVAILVVHHTRKAMSEDFLDAVSGTNGLAGSADAVAVLRRNRARQTPSSTSPAAMSRRPSTRSTSTPASEPGNYWTGRQATTAWAKRAGRSSSTSEPSPPPPRGRSAKPST